MKSIFSVLALSFLLGGCTNSEIRTNTPSFEITETNLQLPDFKRAYFESDIFYSKNIINCLCYRYTNSRSYYNSSKENIFMIEFDKERKCKSLKYFEKDEKPEMKNTLLQQDTSYWIGNKHYFNFETDSAYMSYFTMYDVKDGVGKIEYDSSFIKFKNGKSSYSSVKYDYKTNEVTYNENGKILIQKYFFAKNKMKGINFLARNSRIYKKVHFKYDDKNNLTDMIVENNIKAKTLSNIKKFNYNDNGLLLSILNYKISKAMLHSYLVEGDSSHLISVPFKNEFFEYSFL